MKILKIIFKVLLFLLLLPIVLVLGIFVNYHLISFSVNDKIFTEVNQIPNYEYVLVLGAGHHKPDKWTNYSFINRMKAAITLYEKQKVKKIIVSGAYSNPEYNEVNDMKKVLITFGIPETDIITDNRGTRTWSSIQNAKENQQVNEMVIISQLQQVERAIFISDCMGVNAIGFVAEPTPRTHWYWKIREYLARVKGVLDCIQYKLSISQTNYHEQQGLSTA